MLIIRAGQYQKNDDGTVLISNIIVLLNITVFWVSLLYTFKMLPSISSHLKYKVGSLPQVKICYENWL